MMSHDEAVKFWENRIQMDLNTQVQNLGRTDMAVHPPIDPDGKRKARTFDTGATRDTDENKLDYEGFLSPFVLERFAEYLQHHRVQSDGNVRDSDNWQKGIPKDVYMKSMLRHVMEVWKQHRATGTISPQVEEDLCGVMFNSMGMLLEILKRKEVSDDS